VSKKLAEGIDALVLDVKVGSGAFMKKVEDARTLARTMISIGQGMKKKVVALLTDMDQPLGKTVGNALEVVEAVQMLRGEAPADYTELTVALTAQMVLLAGEAKNESEAKARVLSVVKDGSAEKKLCELVKAQGGDPSAITDLTKLPRAEQTSVVASPRAGFVTRIDTEGIGLAAVALGAGRERTDSKIDPAVGFVLEKKTGDAVQAGEPLVTIHHRRGSSLDDVKARVTRAYEVAGAQPPRKPLILERIE
jgi:pyrimidine-nucleoside phosphorylase